MNPNFSRGFRAMLPITTGVIPFGTVVGTVCADAKFSFFQTMGMNVIVYAGAAQLAAVELMTKNAAAAVVIATGLVINLRFLLYSAAVSPMLQHSRWFTKLGAAYTLTDQSYAVVSANQDKLKTNADAVSFYLGTAVCMSAVWHSSVMAGYVFGNLAPTSLSLDYAVPVSFMALLIPTLKNKKYVAVALFSSVISVLLNSMPYRIGMIVTACLAIVLAIFITRAKKTEVAT